MVQATTVPDGIKAAVTSAAATQQASSSAAPAVVRSIGNSAVGFMMCLAVVLGLVWV